MNNLNLNLLTEQVYLTSQVNRIYESVLNEDESVDPQDVSMIKSLLKEYGIAGGFIFQFGTGIGAFMGPVTELLSGSGVSMSQEEVALLIITAFAIVLSDSKEDVSKLVQSVEDKGLNTHLSGVTKFILSVKKLMGVIGEKLGKTIHTLSDVLGFAFLLVPVMNILKELINTYGVSIDNFGQLLGGLVAAGGAYSIKTIVNRIMKKKGTN
jgi:hypothetical protein